MPNASRSFAELRKTLLLEPENTNKLAGLFKAFAPPGYWDPSVTRGILYVGKATAGSFAERRPQKLWFNHRKTAFWDFAGMLSRAANPDCKALQNVVWTNLFKIGVVSGNPNGAIASLQWDLAKRVLRAEIKQFDPDLVVFVTAGYYEELVRDVLEVNLYDDRFKQAMPVKGYKYDIWFRPADEKLPAILWMYHPERKQKNYLEETIKFVRAQMGWDARPH